MTPFISNAKVGKSIKTENRLVVAKGMTANGYRVSSWVMKIF